MTIRRLVESDWKKLRTIRLRALRTEPGLFFKSYADERGLAEEEWRRLARGGNFAVFGLFDRRRLVGITGAFTHRDDPSGSTAVLGMSYIDPHYRGRGLAALCYDTRLEWIRSQPQFTRVVVSHRRSNERSASAIRRCGFQRTGATSRTWPDGAVDDEIGYEMALAPDGRS